MSSLGRTFSTPGRNPGGSIGRSSTAFMGVGGAKRGGTNTRGTPKKEFDAGFFHDPLSSTGFSFVNKQGNVAFGIPGRDVAAGERMKMVSNPFAKGLLKRSANVRPTVRPKKGFRWEFVNGRWVQRPVGQKPGTPAAPAPAAAPAVPKTFDQLLAAFPQLQNVFLGEQSDIFRQRDDELAALTGQLAGLTTATETPFGMMTPFEAHMHAFQDQQRRSLQREAFEAAQAGLTRSGARQLAARDLANELATEKNLIEQQLGTQAQDAIRAAMEQARIAAAEQEFGLLRGLGGQVGQQRTQEFQQLLDQLAAERQQQAQAFNEVFGLGGG